MSRKRLIYSDMPDSCTRTKDCGDISCDLCRRLMWEDELVNLNKEIDGRILVIADIGTWRGRFSGYKILSNNIRDILYTDCDYAEWYAMNRNVYSTQIHHDGTNYLEYRVIREDKNIDVLLNRLYNQESVSRDMINRYTKSLYPYIAEIYGWR